MTSLKIKVGADPEVFIRNKLTGSYVSAHDKIPGTKSKPHKVPCGAIQVDGMAAEFNIDPAETCNEFIYNNERVLGELRHRMDSALELHIIPTATFLQEYYDHIPTSAKELGCDPDFCAWTGEVNPRPDNKTSMRTAAGHIHIGWTEDTHPFDPVHVEDCQTVVKQMDYFLGIFSLMWDQDQLRRSMYGKAGAMRYKPYGVEYRTLSNQWLKSQDLMKFVYEQTQLGMEMLVDKGVVVHEVLGDMAVNVINNGYSWWLDKGMKDQIMDTLKCPMPVVA